MIRKKVLLAIPPLLQFNSPYPSTGYLYNYLKNKKFDVQQVDWSLELILKVFSKDGIDIITKELKKNAKKTEGIKNFLKKSTQYKEVIDETVSFLQGINNPQLVKKIIKRNYLPEMYRFNFINDNQEMLNHYFFENKSQEQDIAKFFASLFIDDISDVIQNAIDPYWGLAKYGDRLAQSMINFNPLILRLKKQTVIDEIYENIIETKIKEINPDVLGFSVPFPGNVYGALKASLFCKKLNPDIITVMGGGYVNTELKFLTDIRFFKFIDYLVFDDGEKPLELLINYLENPEKNYELLRTWHLDKKNKKIIKSHSKDINDVSFKNLDGPSFDGLNFNKYISMMEYPNQMMRYWTDYKWNKIFIAHGCYWKQCTFCDISLDYISRYEPASAKKLVDQMERLVKETGVDGFHLVDEAAPPVVMKAMADEILLRKFKCNWWGNIRFDEAFTFETAKKLADAGLTAVSGGLEVASDRVLKLISKGVSIEQVAKVTYNLRRANILVHAYLMYGFPTQTKQETIDSLEVVRQLFLHKCLSSAYWHRFSVTAHSPVGLNPSKYQIKIIPAKIPKNGIFAINDLQYLETSNKTDHDSLGAGLKKALYNYQLGIGLKFELQDWFEIDIGTTLVSKNYISKILAGIKS